MDGSTVLSDEGPDPPPRIFERLRQLAGYSWNENQRPFHSSYDNWHVFGSRFVSPYSSSVASPPIPGKLSTTSSGRSAGDIPTTSSLGSDSLGDRPAASPPIFSTAANDLNNIEEQDIVARISYYSLREERTFQIAKNLIASADPDGRHIVKPIDLIRLAPLPGDRAAIIVSIYEDPGPNYLYQKVDLGPAFFFADKVDDRIEVTRSAQVELQSPISIPDFLEFAIGSTQCLEILHHAGMVHGEIRPDALHFNIDTNSVKLVSFGSGVRSFEQGLTSNGWSSLSKELGAKNKLVYISPEQTGRMPAEPDTRTDIYSLGVVFWTILAQQPVFTGASPLDIVQCVLSRRIPLVSSIRTDVHEVLARILQKCTAKNTAERYHSVSGLRYDLQMVQEFLGEGDFLALKEWRIGSRDVSSFFMLPTVMVGRAKERAELVKVIDRVANSHTGIGGFSVANRGSNGSALSNEILDGADASSDGASSVDGGNRRSGSFTQTISSDPRHSRAFMQSALNHDAQSIASDAMSTSHLGTTATRRHWDKHHSLNSDSRSHIDGISDRMSSRQSISDISSPLSRQLGSKFRRRGQCEVVTIAGAGGLGKSFLVQQVLADARRRGFCATAKFDTARRVAFGPLLNLVSSLFKQVWGERNTETPLHLALKDYVRPIWSNLHKTLGLPEFLLGTPDTKVTRSVSSAHTTVDGRLKRSPMKRRGSSPGKSPPAPGISKSPRITSQSSQEFLRSNAATTKTVRLMNTFLDILRIFSNFHFISLCLDDLHYADDESLDLITQLIAARLKILLILTYRPDELDSEKLERVINPSEPEDHPKSVGPRVTAINLSPLSEDEIIQYVATTLCRSTEDVASLALVIESKTAGNPFYMREMLNACHRKKCIWYDHRESRWLFDLDRLFEQFQGEHDYDVLDNAFITRRLSELPLASRSILAWASLLGNSFSFALICQLLTGEFSDQAGCRLQAEAASSHYGFSKPEAVAGLQAAVNACIIVQSETDDWFRFVHDRYIQAASTLAESDTAKMHFVIAQTLMRHSDLFSPTPDSIASHICEASDVIKSRLTHRRPFRKHLMECAAEAAENGARPTAIKYYSRALSLLQANPWSTSEDDTSYDETLQLFLRTAECYIYMGSSTHASGLLQIVFDNAQSAGDKAPAWLLLSRIQAQSGDSESARATLKDSLRHLAVPFDPSPTYEKCDEEFMKLATTIKSLDKPSIPGPLDTPNTRRLIIGSILSDACSAAFWSDCLDFYNLSLTLINVHLREGPFPQSGMAFLHISMIALSRFNMIEYAAELGSICVEFLDKYRDPFSQARGYMIHSNFVSHINTPMSEAVMHLDHVVDYATAAGDRISTLLAFGLSAQTRFFASENVIDLESMCQYCCEEIPGWHLDTRGGTFLIGVRQLCRALQGKTNVASFKEVMSDEHHSTSNYKKWLITTTRNGGRSVLFYETMEIIPLFLYGHYEQACELGRRCLDRLGLIWSARNTRVVFLYYGLSLAGLMLRKMNHPRNSSVDLSSEIKETIGQIEGFNRKIKDWSDVSDINYLAWSKWLDAQVAELRGDHGFAIEQYETALDHASEHRFIFEEALGSYLMAGFFIRRSARRSAAALLRESVGLWRQLGATGITTRIEEEHMLLLRSPTRNFRTAEVAVQTEIAGDTGGAAYTPEPEELPDALQSNLTEITANRMAAWRGSMQPDAGVGLPALDMIDLHSILVSSQIISSVLQVDELLKTMCQVILENCGSSATQASIVVQDESDVSGEWCIAASGDPERGATAHHPRLSLSGASHVAENVVLYCTRFREPLFIPDLLSDERFGNVNNTWLQRNPLSKAVIAIPICHGSKPLLGVLYLEGQPGSFTDRNVTVLQLLVNQIGISYSNALAMKAVEKVSAENNSMIEVQRKMVVQAREAETKAKNAEAEAKRNVKIAEEAAKAKGIFLANVSHELRTPLNGVIGNSELLRDGNLNKEQMEMADSIRVSADLLLTVINDILDFSKMEADKMKLYIIAFNPEEMIREVVRAASYRNREKTSKTNVQIIKDINLPRMLIYGDPIRLHQVLGNLIGNSLKFTEDGSVTIGARVESETTEQVTLIFWVRDTGIGIPQQQLPKLFKPFSQADPSTARKYGGSGLGLSICKSLIETMMKGKIQLDSEANVGTTAWFTITFDKANPEASAGDVQQSVSTTLAMDRNDASPPARRLSVLNPFTNLISIPREQIRICIAEDNLINQRIAIQYVRKLGYTNVDAYENGLKAVEGLRRKAREGQPYQVVLMDVQMPVLDGYEATKLLRKDELEDVRKVLVIAMTASAIQGDREKCLAAGMNDYLAKPVKADLLKRKLDAYTVGTQERDLAAEQSHRADGTDASISASAEAETPAPSPPIVSEREFVTNTSPPLVAPVTERPDLPRSSGPYSAPSRTSSDTRLSDRGSVTDITSDASIMSSSHTSRRQPRKLTKSRNNSDVGMAAPERPRGVLRKNRRPNSISNTQDLDSSLEHAPTLSSNAKRSFGDDSRPPSLRSNGSGAGTLGFFKK